MTALDHNSPVPLYYQLRESLLRQIQNGEIETGQALPAERELEEIYGVSRITVRRALSELASRGLISREPGRGTFVLPKKLEHSSHHIAGIRDDLRCFDWAVDSRIIELEMRPAPNHVASKLNIGQGQPLLYVVRLVLADDEPLMITTGYHFLRSGITLTSEELKTDSIFRLLQEKYGMSFSRTVRVIEATLALESEAEMLHVEPNSPALLAELLVYDEDEQPVSFMKNIYRGDRYKYRHVT